MALPASPPRVAHPGSPRCQNPVRPSQSAPSRVDTCGRCGEAGSPRMSDREGAARDCARTTSPRIVGRQSAGARRSSHGTSALPGGLRHSSAWALAESFREFMFDASLSCRRRPIRAVLRRDAEPVAGDVGTRRTSEEERALPRQRCQDRSAAPAARLPESASRTRGATSSDSSCRWRTTESRPTARLFPGSPSSRCLEVLGRVEDDFVGGGLRERGIFRLDTVV